ncbi:MAG: hypothetical protein JO025_05810 [Verrucomicrobia bacterium]|nr:hypothetical protein [Verrucomicrobiota bacterium]
MRFPLSIRTGRWGPLLRVVLALLTETELDPKLRELVILRVPTFVMGDTHGFSKLQSHKRPV